jgi:hypothetical protein
MEMTSASVELLELTFWFVEIDWKLPFPYVITAPV